MKLSKNKPVFVSVTAGVINAKTMRTYVRTADIAMAVANAREEIKCQNLLCITVMI